MTTTQAQKLFNQANHYYVLGKATGIMTRITKQNASHVLAHLGHNLTDEWVQTMYA